MRRQLPILMWFVLLACQDTALQQGNAKQKDSSSDSTNNTEQVVPPPIHPDFSGPLPIPEDNTTYTPWSPLPDNAAIPVAVSGASLFCHKESGVSCQALDHQGKPYGFKVNKAYYAMVETKTWVKVSFRDSYDTPDTQDAMSSSWVVDLPAEIQSQDIAILLINEQSLFVADWLIKAPSSGANILADSSFELQKIDPQNPEMTRYLTPFAQKNWIARLPVPVEPCYPILELSSNDFDPIAKASDGNQWIELTANCQPGLGSQRNLIGVSQAVKLELNHNYQISFDFKAPLGTESPTLLKLTLGDEVLLKREIAESSWTKYKTIFKAKKIDNKLDFEEMGLVENRGTAIDNVSVIDLGNFGQ